MICTSTSPTCFARSPCTTSCECSSNCTSRDRRAGFAADRVIAGWSPGFSQLKPELQPRPLRNSVMVTNEGISASQGVPELGEEQARELINRWGAAGFLRLRNMGDKIFIDKITPGTAFTIRLQTHYEQRRVQGAAEPYRGGMVDDRGRPPDPWDVNVRQPASFEERTEIVPIPHTERVQMC